MLMYCRLNSRSAADCSRLSVSASAAAIQSPISGTVAWRWYMPASDRHRLGARLAAADRHMRRLVGAKDRKRVLQAPAGGGRDRQVLRKTWVLPNLNSREEDINFRAAASAALAKFRNAVINCNSI